jgi:hypothetical protein
LSEAVYLPADEVIRRAEAAWERTNAARRPMTLVSRANPFERECPVEECTSFDEPTIEEHVATVHAGLSLRERADILVRYRAAEMARRGVNDVEELMREAPGA